MVSRLFVLLFVSLLGAVVLFPPSAYAYVDPGTGSFMLQIIVAGIAAASFSLKLFWGRIKSFFSKGSAAEKIDEQDD
ncbi:MAG: hypothetical protein JSU96_10895 [Acidobacteriota bacterium]|nr:MAG: hypothetical protein JSU96_10895 [Acidobacteriota bacterium]